MTLKFDDWNESDGPQFFNQIGGIESLAWFEVEAGGPGSINRMAIVKGVLLTQIADSRNMGDGTITLDTGYGLNPNSDTWSGLIKNQNGPLVSCYVVLSSIAGQDDSDLGGVRSGWLESVSADLRTLGNKLELFLTIQANLDGDIAFMRMGYQVVLLFNSNRPPAAPGNGILLIGIVEGAAPGRAMRVVHTVPRMAHQGTVRKAEAAQAPKASKVSAHPTAAKHKLRDTKRKKK